MSQRDNVSGENRAPAKDNGPAELVAKLPQITGLPALVCRDALASIPPSERDAAIQEIESGASRLADRPIRNGILTRIQTALALDCNRPPHSP
jgi:hypothetical protein